MIRLFDFKDNVNKKFKRYEYIITKYNKDL